MITIIDYGSGNVNAFANIYKRLNIPFVIGSEKSLIEKAQKLILPGVGAFDNNIKKLKSLNILDILEKKVLIDQTPILGVCLGLQILARDSEEGMEKGLDWIKGSVKKFKKSKESKTRIPHMGWNTIEVNKTESKLFKNINFDKGFYFIHSFYLKPENQEDVLSFSDHGIKFVSSIERNNIYATQFHPEKSHNNGIQLLKNFSEL